MCLLRAPGRSVDGLGRRQVFQSLSRPPHANCTQKIKTKSAGWRGAPVAENIGEISVGRLLSFSRILLRVCLCDLYIWPSHVLPVLWLERSRECHVSIAGGRDIQVHSPPRETANLLHLHKRARMHRCRLPLHAFRCDVSFTCSCPIRHVDRHGIGDLSLTGRCELPMSSDQHTSTPSQFSAELKKMNQRNNSCEWKEHSGNTRKHCLCLWSLKHGGSG